MEEKKKINPKFKVFFYLLLIIFGFLYFSANNGYYENMNRNNTIITNDAIKEFEYDVSLGKEVDLKDYIEVDNNDYKNKYSELGFNISKFIDTMFNDGSRIVYKLLKALFT